MVDENWQWGSVVHGAFMLRNINIFIRICAVWFPNVFVIAMIGIIIHSKQKVWNPMLVSSDSGMHYCSILWRFLLPFWSQLSHAWSAAHPRRQWVCISLEWLQCLYSLLLMNGTNSIKMVYLYCTNCIFWLFGSEFGHNGLFGGMANAKENVIELRTLFEIRNVSFEQFERQQIWEKLQNEVNEARESLLALEDALLSEKSIQSQPVIPTKNVSKAVDASINIKCPKIQ